MKLGSEGGFRAKGLGWAVQDGPGDWVHRWLCSDGSRLQRHEQEKTGNVNFPDSFVRFGLGFYWGILLYCVFKTGSYHVVLGGLELTM